MPVIFLKLLNLGSIGIHTPCGGCARSSNGSTPTPAARQQLPKRERGHGVQTVPFPVHTAWQNETEPVCLLCIPTIRGQFTNNYKHFPLSPRRASARDQSPSCWSSSLFDM